MNFKYPIPIFCHGFHEHLNWFAGWLHHPTVLLSATGWFPVQVHPSGQPSHRCTGSHGDGVFLVQDSPGTHSVDASDIRKQKNSDSYI